MLLHKWKESPSNRQGSTRLSMRSRPAATASLPFLCLSCPGCAPSSAAACPSPSPALPTAARCCQAANASTAGHSLQGWQVPAQLAAAPRQEEQRQPPSTGNERPAARAQRQGRLAASPASATSPLLPHRWQLQQGAALLLGSVPSAEHSALTHLSSSQATAAKKTPNQHRHTSLLIYFLRPFQGWHPLALRRPQEQALCHAFHRELFKGQQEPAVPGFFLVVETQDKEMGKTLPNAQVNMYLKEFPLWKESGWSSGLRRTKSLLAAYVTRTGVFGDCCFLNTQGKKALTRYFTKAYCKQVSEQTFGLYLSSDSKRSLSHWAVHLGCFCNLFSQVQRPI